MGYVTNYDYLTEIQKLANGLMKKGIPFKFHKLYEGFQIVVFSDDDFHFQIWDAVCHSGSYGHSNGLLEVYGTISQRDDDVEGWLTAEGILARL